MSDNKHDGILSHYRACDTVVVSANLIQFESLMIGENEREKIALAQHATCAPKKPLHPIPLEDTGKPSPTPYLHASCYCL